MSTLTARIPSRLGTQTANLTTLLAMVEEDPKTRRICALCWVEKPTLGAHVCHE